VGREVNQRLSLPIRFNGLGFVAIFAASGRLQEINHGTVGGAQIVGNIGDGVS
jgi:hypothetical protein